MPVLEKPLIVHPKYNDLIMDIEHASLRQSVKHGYILIWTNINRSGYEQVISWKIYRSRKVAIDAMPAVAATIK